MDRAFRLLIPVSLRQRLGLEGTVTMLGCGDYVELWNSAACGEEMAGSVETYAEQLARLAGDD